MDNFSPEPNGYCPVFPPLSNYPLPYPHQYPPFHGTFNQEYQTLKRQYDALLIEHQTLQQQYRQLEQSLVKKRHFKRRNQSELNKCFSCPYELCKKEYASDYALNLHIKNKHNGGRKKDRDRAAKELMRCEQEGKKEPRLKINLPPNYLEQNRIRLMLMDSEQLSQLSE